MVQKTRPFVVTIFNSKKITRDRHKFWQKYCNSTIYSFGCALHLAAFKSEELSLASYEMRLTKYLFNNQNYIFGCSIVFYVLTGFNWRQSAVYKTKALLFEECVIIFLTSYSKRQEKVTTRQLIELHWSLPPLPIVPHSNDSNKGRKVYYHSKIIVARLTFVWPYFLS